jgi:hypothetical protein
MKEIPMMKHVLTKSNCFEWVQLGEYVYTSRGRDAVLLYREPKNPKTLQIKEKNTNDDEEEETSKDDEYFDYDVDEEIIEEPLKKRAQIDPIKTQKNSESFKYVRL